MATYLFLPVVQTQSGRWMRGNITKVKDLAGNWAMRTGFEINARDAVVLYAEDEAKLEVLWKNLTEGNLDEKREALENGNCCGDHDTPYVIGLPNALASRGLAQLLASVRAGELGGENDGADQGPDALPAQAA